MKFPVDEVRAVPETRRHGDKDVVTPLEADQGGVRALAVGAALAVFFEMLVAVAQIQWVAVSGFHAGAPPILPQKIWSLGR